MSAVEKLKIKNMLRKHKLAKAISDVSWAEFFRMLEYKAKLDGCDVVKVDTFYPSRPVSAVAIKIGL